MDLIEIMPAAIQPFKDAEHLVIKIIGAQNIDQAQQINRRAVDRCGRKQQGLIRKVMQQPLGPIGHRVEEVVRLIDSQGLCAGQLHSQGRFCLFFVQVAE